MLSSAEQLPALKINFALTFTLDFGHWVNTAAHLSF